MLAPVESPPEREQGPSLFDKLIRRLDGCDVSVFWTNRTEDQKVVVDDLHGNVSERMHAYGWKEPIVGQAVLRPSSSSYRNSGVLIECIGYIQSAANRLEFFRQEKRFEATVVPATGANFPFDFGATKERESYRGFNVSVHYILRITVMRPIKNIVEEAEFWVSRVDEERSTSEPDACARPCCHIQKDFDERSVSMAVGVGDVLHIEFRYEKQVFHLRERVLGWVTYKKADLDIRHGEVAIVRKETINDGPTTSETLQSYEIMDGMPIVGEVVPIRIHLSAIPTLSPTIVNDAQFQVQYFINLVLVTEEGKRYFKQQEIILYRRTGQEAPYSVRSLHAKPS